MAFAGRSLLRFAHCLYLPSSFCAFVFDFLLLLLPLHLSAGLSLFIFLYTFTSPNIYVKTAYDYNNHFHDIIFMASYMILNIRIPPIQELSLCEYIQVI